MLLLITTFLVLASASFTASLNLDAILKVIDDIEDKKCIRVFLDNGSPIDKDRPNFTTVFKNMTTVYHFASSNGK